jgi:alanyl-tRNA synthetase
MTIRLYYSDSYLKEFSGLVLQRHIIGGRPAVVLDQTAFYPTSGGQPNDTGTLGNALVLDVIENEAGDILHVLDADPADNRVRGQIDWTRRFDHMQQHTGQHILSQAFIVAAQAPTVSFHLGQETSTIDIDLAPPPVSVIEETETLATRIVFEDRPVNIFSSDREKLSSLGIRKESQREGEIRVIDVEGFDRSACGGTHVRRTGEIGMICILGFERYKGGTRVEFVAGYRALKKFHGDNEILKRLGKIYSSSPDLLPELSEKLLQERSALSRDNQKLHEQILEMEAADLLLNAKKTGSGVMVRRVFAGRNLETIKLLAHKLAATPHACAVLATDSCQLVIARSADMTGNCNEAIKQVTAKFGGRGGGKPELAQAGGIPSGSLKSCLDALEEFFSNVQT